MALSGSCGDAIQRGEFLGDGEFGIDRRPAGARRGDELRQAVIGLGADDNIDEGGAPYNLGALGLGDATGNADGDLATGLSRSFLQHAEAPEIGIDLFRRFLANMAGVEEDEIGGAGVGD